MFEFWSPSQMEYSIIPEILFILDKLDKNTLVSGIFVELETKAKSFVCFQSEIRNKYFPLFTDEC